MTDPVAEPAPAAEAPPAAAAAENNDAGQSGAPDEDYSKEYEPLVSLSEVETKTGEEDEDIVFKIRSKLFRFSKELNEWKERGTGEVRILRHKQNHKMRLLMRREKTLKICLNHYVDPDVKLTENVGSDRSWVWAGVDYADGERDESLFAIRFRDSTNANSFKDAYDEAREHMVKLKGDDKDAAEDAAADDKGDDKTADADAKADAEADSKADAPEKAEEAKEETTA